jgi:6-phosphofructokinase 1
MTGNNLDLAVERLGDCRIPSPMTGTQYVSDGDHVLFPSRWGEVEALVGSGQNPPVFEIAGPREKIYFDPSQLKCGIVTCGGL